MEDKIGEIGFEIINNVYSGTEIDSIKSEIAKSKLSNTYGVRKFLLGKPELQKLIFAERLKEILKSKLPGYFVIRSIYFNKPPKANWFVNWHQDLTINLNEKVEIAGFKNWRILNDRVVVQPNINILNSILTVRIHLDRCNEHNGALRIIPGSHNKGVVDLKNRSQQLNSESIICPVKSGGIMIMKPLLVHSSRRSETNNERGVLHVELFNQRIPIGLNWNEKIIVN